MAKHLAQGPECRAGPVQGKALPCFSIKILQVTELRFDRIDESVESIFARSAIILIVLETIVELDLPELILLHPNDLSRLVGRSETACHLGIVHAAEPTNIYQSSCIFEPAEEGPPVCRMPAMLVDLADSGDGIELRLDLVTDRGVVHAFTLSRIAGNLASSQAAMSIS